MKEKICSGCSKKFEPKNVRKNQKNYYCSRECYKSYRDSKKVKLQCQNCKKDFYRTKSAHIQTLNVSTTGNSFCSRKCLGEYNGSLRKKELSPFNKLIRRAKFAKASKKLGININAEYLQELWKFQKGKCYYSGLDLKLVGSSEISKDYGLISASLDRKDSSIGYKKGNVVFCCMGLNLAKSTYSEKNILNFIKSLNNSEKLYTKSSIVKNLESLISI